jgi:hypothetical protein
MQQRDKTATTKERDFEREKKLVGDTSINPSTRKKKKKQHSVGMSHRACPQATPVRHAVMASDY